VESGLIGRADPHLEWVPLVSVSEEIEATLAAGFLENEGVACVVESRYFSQEPINYSLLGNFVLFVHEDAAERAKRLLEDRLEFPVEPPQRRTLDELLQKAGDASAAENLEQSSARDPSGNTAGITPRK